MEPQDELERLRAENAQLRKQQRTKGFNDFLEKLLNQGVMIPRLRESAEQLLCYADAIDNGETVDFADGDSLVDTIKRYLANQPKAIEFGEIATKERAYSPTEQDVTAYSAKTSPETIKLNERILAYAKDHNTDYSTAFDAVIRQGA